MGRQRPQGFKGGGGELGSVSGEHDGEQGVPEGPAVSQKGRGKNPFFGGGEHNPGEMLQRCQPQGGSGEGGLFFYGLKGSAHGEGHGGDPLEGEHDRRGKPTEARSAEGASDHRNEQKDGSKTVDHRGNGRHEAQGGEENFG